MSFFSQYNPTSHALSYWFQVAPQFIKLILDYNSILQTAFISIALQLKFFSKFTDFNNFIQPEFSKVVFAAHFGVMVPKVETECPGAENLGILI